MIAPLEELIQVQLLNHHIVLEKAVMLVAIDLDEGTVALGDAVDPRALIHCAVSLEHTASAISLVVDKVTLILYSRGPADLCFAGYLALFDRPRVQSLSWLLGLSEQGDCAASDLALFRSRDIPAAMAVLAPLDEVTREHAAVVAGQLAVTLRLAITEVADVAAPVLVRLNSSSVLISVLEQAFINIARVRFQDAVAPGLIVRPHARVVELLASFSPSTVSVPQALVPFSRVSLQCLLLDKLTLAMSLILRELANVDVAVRVALEAFALPHFLLPLAFINA